MTRVYFIFEIKLLVSDLQKLFLLNLTHNYEIMNNSNTRLAIPNNFLPNEYICINYAANLVNSAERNGIKCCLALILFDEYMEKSHTVNIFMLEDGRKMYVDNTGFEYESGKDIYFFNLAEGENYREMGTVFKIYEFW